MKNKNKDKDKNKGNSLRKVIKGLLAALGLSSIMNIGEGVALLNSGKDGVEKSKNEITIDVGEAEKDIKIKNLGDKEVFIEGIKVSNEDLEEISDTTLEDTVVKEVESKKTPDDVLNYLKDIYIQEYNEQNQTNLTRDDVLDIMRNKEGKFLVEDKDEKGNDIIRNRNENDPKDVKTVDISRGLITVRVNDQNSTIVQQVLNTGNYNYTSVAGYDNKVLEEVEKIMDTGITWEDKMDEEDLGDRKKQGYKQNFIKSIVEYKEKQIEEIKTENLGEEER